MTMAAGRLHGIPEVMRLILGISYMMIRSYSNSMYAVAENKASIVDVQDHWGKLFIELVAVQGLDWIVTHDLAHAKCQS